MFKFGTVPFTHTATTIKKYFKEMHSYMQQYNKPLVADGIEAVLNGSVQNTKINLKKF